MPQDDIERLVAERTEVLRRHYLNLKALNEIAALPRVGPEQLVAALELGRRHLGLDIAIISRVDGGIYTVLHHAAPDGVPLEDGMIFPLGDTYCSMTLKADDVVAIDNMGESVHASHPCYSAFRLECYIGAPLIVRGQRFGTINFSSPNVYPRRFDDGDLEFMRLLARWAATALDQQASDRELARSNAELEQFAYAVSHDLRQPLRAISSYSTLLRRKLEPHLDDDDIAYFGHVVDSTKRLDSLIQALLSYSRLGRDARPKGAVDLAAIFAYLSNQFAPQLAEIGATLTLPERLPSVIGDGIELGRLFQNLIDNAVKYRDPARPLAITVTCERQGGKWAIRVADNGIGIAPEDGDRVFGLFSRLHGHEQIPGCGLGLAMCRKIAEGHGGSVTLDTGSAQGSAFTVSLPAA